MVKYELINTLTNVEYKIGDTFISSGIKCELLDLFPPIDNTDSGRVKAKYDWPTEGIISKTFRIGHPFKYTLVTSLTLNKIQLKVLIDILEAEYYDEAVQDGLLPKLYKAITDVESTTS